MRTKRGDRVFGETTVGRRAGVGRPPRQDIYAVPFGEKCVENASTESPTRVGGFGQSMSLFRSFRHLPLGLSCFVAFDQCPGIRFFRHLVLSPARWVMLVCVLGRGVRRGGIGTGALRRNLDTNIGEGHPVRVLQGGGEVMDGIFRKHYI